MHEAVLIKALSPRLAASLGISAINGMHEPQNPPSVRLTLVPPATRGRYYKALAPY